jgi:hypothetical protein
MIKTPENDATSWHDLADQLTPKQVACLERADNNEACLLQEARRYGRVNLHGALYADIPEPAGALKVGEWNAHAVDGRPFEGRSWVVDGGGWHPLDFRVWIQGIQRPTGEVDRVISGGELHPDEPITSAQARQLGEALIAAADEMDGLEAQ